MYYYYVIVYRFILKELNTAFYLSDSTERLSQFRGGLSEKTGNHTASLDKLKPGPRCAGADPQNVRSVIAGHENLAICLDAPQMSRQYSR